MAIAHLASLDLNRNELLNAAIHNNSGPPTTPTPVQGQLYFDTVDNTLYVYDGTNWYSTRGTSPTWSTQVNNVTLGTPTAGAATTTSRGDHTHGITSAAAVTLSASTVNGVGSASTIARSDHTHNIDVTGTPSELNSTSPNNNGSSTGLARANHVHSILTTTNPPEPVGLTAMSAGSALAFARSDHVHGHSGFVRTAGSTMSGFLTLHADPTNALHASTKQYVDNAMSAASVGIDAKESVRVATTVNITLSGTQTIDGIAVVAGNRVLVKNQTTTSQNGIYSVASGAWTRTSDADTSAKVTSGMFTFVEEGTTQANTGWMLSTPDPITLGTTALSFIQFSSQGEILAGNGLTKSGNTLSANYGAAPVNVDPVGSSAGAESTLARSDHKHAATIGTPINVSGTATSAGSTNALARSDHQHGYAFATPGAVTLTGVTAASGSSASAARSDHVHSITGTVPIANGGTGATTAAAARTNLGAVTKYAADIGAITAGGSIVITHNLNTRDLQVEVYRNTTPWDTVMMDVERTTVNTITLRSGVAVAANAFRIVVNA